MANLTIAVDAGILKRARMKAVTQGTSVNALLRDYLAQYAGGSAVQAQAVDHILRLARASRARRGRRAWSRTELHER
jgi:hypothetical protein